MTKLRVREVAVAKGMNMSQLQRSSGVTMPSIRRYWYNTRDGKEHGPALREVDLVVLGAIAQALGISVRDLIENGAATGQEVAEESGNSLPVLIAA